MMDEEMSVTQMILIIAMAVMFGVGAIALALYLV